MKVKKTRNWLTKNKIFFEVSSLTILGVASFFVAVFSYNVSKNELDILKLEHRPIINIQNTNSDGIPIIKVLNVGYHLFEPKINLSSFVKLHDYKTINDQKDIYIKLFGMFN